LKNGIWGLSSLMFGVGCTEKLQAWCFFHLPLRPQSEPSSVGGLYVCAGGLDIKIWQKFH